MRSRYGNGRHRQALIPLRCPGCGQTVEARRTRPGAAWHVKAHLTDEGVCPVTTVAVSEISPT